MYKIKKYTLIIAFLLLAVIFRFIWLNNVPVAIGGDELNYVITAKAIFLNGTDILGNWNPLSIFAFNYPYAEGQAELNYFLLYPFTLTSFSLFNIKFIFSLLSVFSVFLIYLITKKLFDEKVAMVAGFVSALNPWFIFIGRTGYEVVPALFFALLSFYILLITKNWKILISIPFLFCLFYSYIGVKLIILPFVLAILLYLYFYQNNKKFLKQYLIVFFACLALVLFFIVSLKLNSSGSRMGELFLINNNEVVKQVDEARKLTIQSPITNLIENKLTVYAKVLTTKFLNIFSFDYLFLRADQFVGVERHGLFYYLDFLFLLLGIIFLASKNKKLLTFLLILIFIGTLPHVFHKARTDNFTPHIFLIFPFLIMLISLGIKESFSLFKQRYLNIILIVAIVLLYAFLVVNFFNIYFFNYPLRGNFDFQVRILSKYANSIDKENKVTIYTNESFDYFKKYLFYTNSYNSKTFKNIKEAVVNRNYVINNVKFTDCQKDIDFSNEKEIIIIDSSCPKISVAQKHLTIPLLIDGGESLKIFNDNLCSNFRLKTYPNGLKISDFNIENLAEKDFCEAFITSL